MKNPTVVGIWKELPENEIRKVMIKGRVTNT